MRALALLVVLAPSLARADLDLVFLIDTTGSMGGEIQEAKERVRQIAEALSKQRPNQRLRIGVVAYRDRGDEYVTKVSRLDDRVEVSFAFLAALRADGGGDGPEDVVAGLLAAIREMSWDERPTTERQVFLIGDAPPPLDYADAPKPEDVIAEAVKKRIVINAIGCRSLPPSGVEFFRRVAYGTEGSYQHIGRVSAGDGHLAQAMLRALAPRGSDDAPPTGPISGLRVTPMARGGRTCELLLSVPPGVELAGAPRIRRGEAELVVELSLRPGRGGIERYELAECVSVKTPIRTVLGE